jgi:hypothetical protein
MEGFEKLLFCRRSCRQRFEIELQNFLLDVHLWILIRQMSDTPLCWVLTLEVGYIRDFWALETRALVWLQCKCAELLVFLWKGKRSVFLWITLINRRARSGSVILYRKSSITSEDTWRALRSKSAASCQWHLQDLLWTGGRVRNQWETRSDV